RIESRVKNVTKRNSTHGESAQCILRNRDHKMRVRNVKQIFQAVNGSNCRVCLRQLIQLINRDRYRTSSRQAVLLKILFKRRDQLRMTSLTLRPSELSPSLQGNSLPR